MKRKQLIDKLMKYGDDDTNVVVFSMVQVGTIDMPDYDVVLDHPIHSIHDGWNYGVKHDTICIDVTRDK